MALNGREFFAEWMPHFDNDMTTRDIGQTYLTDANGLELMTREVFVDQSASFASSFYPVTSMISVSDASQENALTIWNDRA